MATDNNKKQYIFVWGEMLISMELIFEECIFWSSSEFKHWSNQLKPYYTHVFGHAWTTIEQNEALWSIEMTSSIRLSDYYCWQYSCTSFITLSKLVISRESTPAVIVWLLFYRTFPPSQLHNLTLCEIISYLWAIDLQNLSAAWRNCFFIEPCNNFTLDG